MPARAKTDHRRCPAPQRISEPDATHGWPITHIGQVIGGCCVYLELEPFDALFRQFSATPSTHIGRAPLAQRFVACPGRIGSPRPRQPAVIHVATQHPLSSLYGIGHPIFSHGQQALADFHSKIGNSLNGLGLTSRPYLVRKLHDQI